GVRLAAARRDVQVRGRRAPRLLDLRLQARRLLAVRPDRRPEARQRDRARAEGEAGAGAARRAGPDAVARAVRRAGLVRPDADEHLPDVLAAEETGERRRHVLDPVEDRLAVLQLPVADPRPDLGEKFGEARVVVEDNVALNAQ